MFKVLMGRTPDTQASWGANRRVAIVHGAIAMGHPEFVLNYVFDRRGSVGLTPLDLNRSRSKLWSHARPSGPWNDRSPSATTFEAPSARRIRSRSFLLGFFMLVGCGSGRVGVPNWVVDIIDNGSDLALVGLAIHGMGELANL
jgi:hypothetical protein